MYDPIRIRPRDRDQKTNLNSGVTRLSDIIDDDLPNNEELSRLIDPLIKDQTVLGIGENVHGSKKILQMESRIVKYAVEKKGVRTIFTEEGFLAAKNLNDYVQTCQGDLAKLIKIADKTSPDQQIKLMQWLCAFNQKNPNDRVSIYGVDIYNFSTVDHQWFLEQLKATKIYDQALTILDQTKGKCVGAFLAHKDYMAQLKSYRSLTAINEINNLSEQMDECVDILNQLKITVTNFLYANQTENVQFPAFDRLQKAQLENYARSLIYFQQYWKAIFIHNMDMYEIPAVRDNAMSQNLLTLWNALGKPKSLFMSHTSHAAKHQAPFYGNQTDKIFPETGENVKNISPAGSYIFKSIGNKYKVIGFTSYETSGSDDDYVVPTSLNSLDLFMHNQGYTHAWMDVGHTKIFNHTWWVQNENKNYDEKDFESTTVWPDGVFLNPSQCYDVMIYIDRSEADTLL